MFCGGSEDEVIEGVVLMSEVYMFGGLLWWCCLGCVFGCGWISSLYVARLRVR